MKANFTTADGIEVGDAPVVYDIDENEYKLIVQLRRDGWLDDDIIITFDEEYE